MENYMEVLVNEVFQEMETSFGGNLQADFEILSHDIKAYALNNLKPMYFSSDITAAEKKAFLLDKQRRIEVTAKLAEAYRIISTGK